ncbi:MAG TPA: hypothetical protein VF746_11710 [Longimicrobium sp.]|jgi:hypothetical protein
MTLRSLAAAALALALAACPRPYPSTQPRVPARLGEEVALAPGQTAGVEGERLAVSFLRVAEDSRCPQGVQCVRAGEAKVELELRVDDRVEGVVLATPVEPRSAALGPYRVHLVRLDPLPTREGPPERYTATLRIEKP